MTLIRKLALALFLALLCSKYSNSQTVDSTTGNLVNFTGVATDTTSVWNGAGSVGQPLTCWAYGDPGYCGPNPRVSAWGAGSNVINFSYGRVDLNQIVNINIGLASVGSNIQLSGFNFGFTAKNGNGWDNGRQDYLGAYVNFYNSAGTAVESYDYTTYTNSKYNWTQFNFSETFAKSYVPSTLSTARYGFVGQDLNGWMGPYGPEITNVNFSLKYSVKPDPCINDPLSSPTCPGYALATVKNSILGSTVSNASVTSFVPTTNYASPAPAAAPPAVADAAPALAQASPQQQAQQPAQSPPPAPAPDANQNPSVAQDNPAQPSPQQAGPAPTQPQPAGGPPQTATASAPPPSAGPQQAGPVKSNDGPKMTPGAALNVARSAQEKDKAIQAAAVQNAAKAFENTVQSSQSSSNAAITMNQDMSANSASAAAQFSSQTTQTSMQTMTQSIQPQTTAQQSVSAQSQGSRATQSTQQTTSGTGLTVSGNPFAFNPFSSLNTSNISLVQPMQSAPAYQPRLQERAAEIEAPQLQLSNFGGAGKAGSPLNDIMNQRFESMQTNIEQRSETVKKNVQPNELAGGVDVAAMAQIPKGYEAYSIVTLRDASFYKPEAIYKNNRTVDNANVFRGLTGGSDAKHQQMVDQQYNIGN